MRPGCFLFVINFLLSLSCYTQPIGSWQEHISFHSAISVGTNGNQLITASPQALFQYDPSSEEFKRITKINGLSETGIQTISNNQSLTVIAYRNSQLDLLENNTTRSVNTIRLSSITADKRIYDIWMENAQCLLATGFGLAVLNLEKAEIGDVYLIASGGAFSKMNAVTADQQYFYSAGESGFYRAPRAGLNLADFRNWTLLSGQNGLPSGQFQQVLFWKGSIYVQQNNRIYKQVGTDFSLWYQDQWQWNTIDVSETALMISQRSAGNARVLLLNESANPVNQLEHPLIQWPKQSLFFQQQYWVADSINGLLQIDGNNLNRLIPNSPAGIGSGGLFAGKKGWWMATGEKLNQFTEGNWKGYQAADQNWPAGFGPIGPLVEALDGTLWAGSSSQGLCYLHESGFQVFKENILSASVQEPGNYKVGGLALDAEQRLWITNDGATEGLVVRFPDGNSKSFEIPFFYPSLRLSELLIDDLNQKWLAAPGNGLFCFNQGASIENTGDDQWRYYQAGSGKGNLPSNQVLSMVKDKFGFIWLGTSDGIGILQCPEQVFSGQGCEVLLPVVQTDNFAGYLFKGEAVQAMAVDGANRKWIGTKNGIWLISASGDETLLRFTTANSPLPDNDIHKIAIDPKTGTVLISTAQGLVSYQSTATEGGTTSSNVLAYPNPVTPGYTGPIAIRGLVNNAVVKITELNGRLVYQGRALGGQAIWNGLDLNGKRVSTGVYLVWISDDSRQEQAVTKIVFIQ
ncbi:two-component regulator propeller domain-containing protein [Flavihumibacter sp. UBA7668]|uniref:type IX secretion system anionic LPS delivery protein PorZ n=1 Tax=Flavihumibacter sp. UBA7668 TaxID=1946542 RepID=UPI0025C204A0|nr:two-component regulator propeller domain-containing protein [Flavihumibacter sp. UBA7668]